MMFFVYNKFTGFIVVNAKKQSKIDCYNYISTIYGTHFIPVPKRIEKFFLTRAI